MLYRTCEATFRASDPALAMAVVREGPSDLHTPVGAALRLFRPGEAGFLLESAEGGESVGRYSFLGVHETARTSPGADLDELRAFADRHRLAPTPLPEVLPGGAVGYVGYDAVRLVEAIPDRHGPGAYPDLLFVHFRDLVVFDHLRQRIYLVTIVPAGEARDEAAWLQANAALDVLAWRLQAPLAALRGERSLPRVGPLRVTPDASDFEAQVERAREYILAGDVFQVVLSRRFERPFEGDPFEVYRALRMINPSPFMFYLDTGEMQLVGASPEDLVRVQGRRVETLPIAGTRKRGATAEEDVRLAEELLADEKERAEHLMLVDLARNDIGRVARPGTVTVPGWMKVERYSHVMHLVSRVRGELRDGIDSVDALLACFPAGTVSGAPKVRAMEIIDEMETVRRGIYAGAVGYFDGLGNFDTCIAIRTLVLRDGVASVNAGAGIVADSRPDAEEEETRNKARAVLAALEWAGRLGHG